MYTDSRNFKGPNCVTSCCVTPLRREGALQLLREYLVALKGTEFG